MHLMEEERRLSFRARILNEPFAPDSPPPLRSGDEALFHDDSSLHEGATDLSFVFSQLKLCQDTTEDAESIFSISISPDDERLYRESMSKLSRGEKLTSDGTDLTTRDLQCLAPTNWLNDEIVNAFMKLLQQRDSRSRMQPNGRKCHFFNSFLLTKIMSKYEYDEVRKWTDKRKLRGWGQMSNSILECDCVFFPYHASDHWSVIVADLNTNALSLYDSMLSPNTITEERMNSVKSKLKKVCAYLIDEARARMGQEWSEDRFELELGVMPQQRNSWDCGVYVIQTVKYLSMRKPLLFSQGDMNHFRIKMFKELIEGYFL